MKMFHEMMDAVIRKYGFENENTISFCHMCESQVSTIKIVARFNYLMNGGEKKC